MTKKCITIVIVFIYCFVVFGNDVSAIKNSGIKSDKTKHELIERLEKDKAEYTPKKDYLTQVGVSSAFFASSSITTMLFLGLISFGQSFNGGTDGYFNSKACVMTPVGVGSLSVIANIFINALSGKSKEKIVNQKNNDSIKRISTLDVMTMESEKNANEWAFYWAGLLINMIFLNPFYTYNDSATVLLPAALLMITTLLVVLVGRQTKSSYDMNAFGKKIASEYNSELVKSTGLKRGTAYLYGSFTALSLWMIGMTILGLKTIDD